MKMSKKVNIFKMPFTQAPYAVVFSKKDFKSTMQDFGYHARYKKDFNSSLNHFIRPAFAYRVEPEDLNRLVLVYVKPTFKKKEVIYMLKSLTHEAVHLASWYLRGIGEAEEADEFRAYLTAEISSNFFSEYYKKVIKNK